MADHLARIFGTEEDRVNCPFFFKIGACRHGDQCSRIHNRPVVSQTIVFKNMFQNPPAAIAMAEGQAVNDRVAEDAQEHFEAFYEEVFLELAKYGEVEDMGVVDNIGDHMIGTVYVKFASESSAEACTQKISGRFYAGRLLQPEYCPVTDFAEARCRQYDDAQCSRGGYCNFVHWKHVPTVVKRRLRKRMLELHPEFRGVAERVRRRSKTPPRRKSPRRETSEDRRAKVAQWNREKEQFDESQL